MKENPREFAELVGRNIKKHREANGMTQEELGMRIGYTNPQTAKNMIYQYEVGERMPRAEQLKKIAQELNQSFVEFYLQPGESREGLDRPVPDITEHAVYYMAGAGNPASLIEGEPIDHIILQKDLLNNNTVVVKVRGRSMEPTLMSGAYIGVDVNDKRPESGELFVVWINGEGALVKRIYIDHGDTVRVVSDNKEFDAWVRNFKELDDHFIQGRVKWVIQKY